ncbi:hypothetical protein N9955_00990 [bacterium]|nr:hypothetical protein [bacterium]
MIFVSAQGKSTKIKNSHKYLVDWDKPCRSKFQLSVKKILQSYWSSDIVFEELPVVGTRLTIDLYNATRKIALEADGNQHYKLNPHFHGGDKNKFMDQLKRDKKKELFCEFNGIELIRVLESDTLDKQLLKKLKLI